MKKMNRIRKKGELRYCRYHEVSTTTILSLRTAFSWMVFIPHFWFSFHMVKNYEFSAFVRYFFLF